MHDLHHSDTGLEISDDKGRLDVPLIHQFLSQEAYWCLGIPLSTVQRAINHSFCIGGYLDGQQVAFARVITDHATFGYLSDVFVLPAHRGLGHGKALIQAIVSHPNLQGLRRISLATSDAHGLYSGFGFQAPVRPATLMERYQPDIYQQDHSIR
ncbi:GNAT superfamily N-acetyltransferase [Aeromonas sp. BIGb0405]|jgi:GNAT superfamily N-acetyltransferase|uniref:GNAT family N-acetyltransferase n=1 Tax=Aeromonas sp. BIGb0405 TaxID=2940592 RepID=UPI00216A7DD4|nr:GNAT family N-acetyltransferase [Aeromonas sp. BIGb0405]MCS3457261.1 GNAT superfamily N-acetyltransferase [Aeromonas sp. BIGb0405]